MLLPLLLAAFALAPDPSLGLLFCSSQLLPEVPALGGASGALGASLLLVLPAPVSRSRSARVRRLSRCLAQPRASPGSSGERAMLLSLASLWRPSLLLLLLLPRPAGPEARRWQSAAIAARLSR